jgi:hypothetical protein
MSAHAKQGIECSDCHTAFAAVGDRLCTKCHAQVEVEKTSKKGLHALFKGNCVDCHALHQSAGKVASRVCADLVVRHPDSFKLNAHEKQSCADCHGRSLMPFAVGGNKRCAECHQGRKRNRILTAIGFRSPDKPTAGFSGHAKNAGPACTRCHRGGRVVDYRHKEGAKDFFIGPHAQAKCRDCHQGDNYYRNMNDCVDCHEIRHKNAWRGACQDCHGMKAWLPITLKHGPATQVCSNCHQASKQHANSNCEVCHRDYDSWTAGAINHPAVPGEKRHTYLSFSCVSCHQNGYDSATCGQCHQ